MKKTLMIVAVLMLVIFNSVFAIETALSDDPKTAEIFNSLKVNDALKAEAVFTLDTSKETLLSKESFKLVFNEVCGHVKSYVFQIKSICTIQEPIYEVLADNKTEPKIIGYKNVSDICYKEFSELSVGVKDYRVKADIASAVCSDGFMGYRIDWIPSLTIDGTKYIKDDWAWWNATGGSVYYDGLYTVHTFTSNGSFIWVNDTQNISLLIIAGGGGAGAGAGGGGGAGGLIYYGANYTITAGNYTVKVGNGGISGNASAIGGNGYNSSFGAINALGGGGGASNDVAGVGAGGSGGGGSAGGTTTGGAGLAGQGFNGGNAYGSSPYGCGGGGGASALGSNAAAGISGAGGNGRVININGTAVNYSCGGSGGVRIGGTATAPACNSGGLGGSGAVSGTAGFDRTGSGGGGGGLGTGVIGGNGGSGIVIIRYLTPPPPCVENWSITNYGNCLINDSRLKTYSDNNVCNTTVNLPADNGTYTACNYCTEALANSSTICDGSFIYHSYVDNNQTSCCDVTGIVSDCSILYNPYNITTPEACCLEDWVLNAYGACGIDDLMLKTYSDNNVCNTTVNLPADNGTYEACNYCTEDIVESSTACVGGIQTVSYDDNNFVVCCFVTGLVSDCSILYTPYNVEQRVNCTVPTTNVTACDDYNLTVNFSCRYDPKPLLKDKMNIVCIMPDNESYECVVNVFQNTNLLATTPEYKEATDSLINLKPQTDTRTFFTPEKRLLNAFYTSKSIVTDTPFVVEVLCSSMDKDIITEVCVTPEYEGQTWVLGRTKWVSDNISLLIWIFIIALILGGIILYVVKVVRSGY